jgi:NOL1/NOP2/sun family putative RNA methylase
MTFPDADKYEWKEIMLERYAKITDSEAFKKCSLSFLRKSIRVNTLKISVSELVERMKDWSFTPIPWCKEGFWVEHREGRRDIGNTVEHVLGYIYVQEAASMIPPLALEPMPGEAVLDACAAPGSKSTQIAAMMQNKGIVVCNDVAVDRIAALGTNVQRCGVSNAVVVHASLKGSYDRILLDAPCSGTGTIRKSPGTLRTWSLSAVHKLNNTQRELLSTCWKLLKPGGTLVYSTCSVEPEEDECMMSWFLQKNENAEPAEIKLPIKHGPAVTEWDGQQLDVRVSKCLRIWPQDNDTEGFFVAKIVKRSVNKELTQP